jgi:uncharacterized membrane protein (UPF0127 family)
MAKKLLLNIYLILLTNKPFRYMLSGWFIFVIAAILANPASAEELQIITKTGKAHIFQVEVAKTQTQLRRGLMFRKALASDGGMLFIMEPHRQTSMWMQNTYIPLDILFINPDNKITKIMQGRPHDLTPLNSDSICAYVLEINFGRALELNIDVGDKIILK